MSPRPTSDTSVLSTRERILEVAEELISRHGMEGLRLKDVAERVGIQPPSIFAHFDGREAIGDAVAARVLRQIADLLERSIEGAVDPESAVLNGVRAFAGHLMDHPGHARLLLRDLARTRSGSELAMTSPAVDEIESQVDALLARGAEQGQFRPLTGQAFISQIQGAILATVGWSGFDEEGRPATDRSRKEIQDLAEDLARAYVRQR